MVLHLGRGEHCPRERQHHRELLRFHEWCSVAFTQLVTVLPNELHDVFKLKISTGAHWTLLADAELDVQQHFDIREYTDDAPRRDGAAHPDPLAGPEDREGLRRLLVLGPPDDPPALGRPQRDPHAHQGRLRPHHARGARGVGGRPRRDRLTSLTPPGPTLWVVAVAAPLVATAPALSGASRCADGLSAVSLGATAVGVLSGTTKTRTRRHPRGRMRDTSALCSAAAGSAVHSAWSLARSTASPRRRRRRPTRRPACEEWRPARPEARRDAGRSDRARAADAASRARITRSCDCTKRTSAAAEGGGAPRTIARSDLCGGERHAEPLAPDDDAAIRGQVDTARNRVILVADVALRRPEIDEPVVERPARTVRRCCQQITFNSGPFEV